MKKRNGIVSIVLIIGIFFSTVFGSVSNAKSNPRLSKFRVTIDLNSSYIYDESKITGVEKSLIKAVKANSTNNSVATTGIIDRNVIRIYGKSKGKCKVNVTFVLKKKVGGKKKYRKPISVLVKDTSASVVTPIPTEIPTPTAVSTATPVDRIELSETSITLV